MVAIPLPGPHRYGCAIPASLSSPERPRQLAREAQELHGHRSDHCGAMAGTDEIRLPHRATRPVRDRNTLSRLGLSIDADAPGCRTAFRSAGAQVNEGRLAGAVRAEQRKQLIRADGKDFVEAPAWRAPGIRSAAAIRGGRPCPRPRCRTPASAPGSGEQAELPPVVNQKPLKIRVRADGEVAT